MNRATDVYLDNMISSLPSVSRSERQNGLLMVSLFNELLRSNAGFTHAHQDSLEGWLQTLEQRDAETIWHTRRVTRITIELARLIGFQQDELSLISRGAMLHDIGKIAIPNQILLKPGPLDDEEWIIMRQHPVLAFELLSSIPGLQLTTDIPYCHHEKWNGAGYPRSLQGEEIPLAARIFAIVDVWDALTSDRPYRKAWSFEKTQDYIRQQRGQHFDPSVCDVFLKFVHSSRINRAYPREAERLSVSLRSRPD
jgi:HD-GYP domain-containing protein (c-di-GMP phosphodiesterase class II)